MVIFLLSDYPVYIQLYVHFFLFYMINVLFICLAIHTDKYIYLALWLQSSVSNMNCNHPISIVVRREATSDCRSGEQILMFFLIVCDYRQVTSAPCPPSLFICFDVLSSGDCLFPWEFVKSLVCFPPDASS